MKHITRILCIGLLAIGMAACEKEKDEPTNPEPVTPGPVEPDPDPEPTATFALLLNEGGMSGNNASISRIDIENGTIDNNWFSTANGRSLGNNANDMVAYGSKVYITVTESNSLEVLDPNTGNSKRVDMGSRRPRCIATHEGKLYITCYDKTVVRMDTVNHAVEATCTLGDYYPEGIAIAQGKAFVASSYDDNPSYDNKLYVIDLTAFSNPTTITLGTNLSRVVTLDDNHVAITWIGNYDDVAAGTAIINATSHAVTMATAPVSKLTTYNGKIYGYATEYDASWNETAVFRIIAADGSVQPFPFTPSLDDNAYGISINPDNGNMYIMSSNYTTNGDLYIYSPTGSLLNKLETGLNPSKVVFF